MLTLARIHDHLASLDWKQAKDLIDAVTCTGEGKRIAAALESAGRRHATNFGIAAHRIHGHERDYGEIILFSHDGTWRARRYEIHIPIKVDWDVDTDTGVYFNERTWRKDAFMITSTGDGEGMYPYRAPALAAWNALRWAIIHVGQYRACKEGLVKSVNIGGYYQPADRDEKSLDEYFELGWEVVQPIIEQGLNSPALAARNLVIHWKDEDTEPTPEAWELCPYDCDDNERHARVCGYDIVLPSEEREGEESEYVSDIPDLTDPRPICIQDSVWPHWPYNIPYPPKARTWEYQQAQWAAQEAEKEAIVELLLNKGVEMTNVKVSDVLNDCFDSEWFQNLAMKAVDGAVDIDNIRYDRVLKGVEYLEAVVTWLDVLEGRFNEPEPEHLRKAYYAANQALYQGEQGDRSLVDIPVETPSMEVTRKFFEKLNNSRVMEDWERELLETENS